MRKLPHADMYFFEENARITPKDPYLKSKVQLLTFQSSFVALINAGGDNKVNE